ncbi:MAG TPA: hypothetical protein VFG39_06820 [Balneolaceae bacterium]|nr:hypothetical protein [Balneolaceae bacterium]
MVLLLLALIQHLPEFSTSVQGRHNSAPDGILYYLVLIVSSIIVAGVVIWAVKLLIRPGEKSEDHIKRRLLSDEF